MPDQEGPRGAGEADLAPALSFSGKALRRKPAEGGGGGGGEGGAKGGGEGGKGV